MDWIKIDPFNAALYDPRYVNITGDTMVGNLDMNGNTVTDLGNPINASDATPKSYVDSIELIDNNDGTFSLLKADGTIDTVNKASLTDNNDGTYTFNNNDGNPITIDIAALETTTSIVDNGNQTFTYFDENNMPTIFSIVDNDNDASNEIQNVESSDGSVTVTSSGNDFDLSVTPFDDATLQAQITTNATDIAALETEQVTQNTNIQNNTDAIDAHVLADEDIDATNEIQTVASADSSVSITTDANNNIDLSVTPFDDAALQAQITTNATDIATNVTDIATNATDITALEAEQVTQNTAIADNTTNIATNTTDIATNTTDITTSATDIATNVTDIATNATDIAALETEQVTQNTNIQNNTDAIDAHVLADEDIDATNEIQTVASADSSVSVTTDANNNFDLSVTPFDDAALQAQITTNTTDIDTLEAEQVTQNTAIADNATNIATNTTDIATNVTDIATNATDIADHIANDLDTDPTNELQDISLNGTELVLSNPATSGNLVDLTGQITLPMFADGTNTNDEIYWDGTQWVYGTRVASVNLSTPDTDGNINIPIGNVFTGPTTNTGDIGTIEIGGTPQEGDIYVVNSNAADPAQVGTTYIYDADTMDWIEIDPFNAALYDPRYVNITGDTMVGNLDMNGNTVTDLGNPINASDATPKSYVDSIELIDNNDGTFSLLKADGTIDTVNKASLTDNNDGTYTFNNNDGNPITIDIAALETTTSIVDNGNQTFTYFDENNMPTIFSIVDNDNDASNEIQNVESSDGSVTVTSSGNDFDLSVTPFDDAALQAQITTNATDISTNVTDIATNVTDITALEAEQVTQNTAIADNTTNIATNTTDITTNATDIAALETEQVTQNTNIQNNTDAIDAHVLADEDVDATNEIQTVASADSSVSVTTDANNNIDLSVTPFDDAALQAQNHNEHNRYCNKRNRHSNQCN